MPLLLCVFVFGSFLNIITTYAICFMLSFLSIVTAYAGYFMLDFPAVSCEKFTFMIGSAIFNSGSFFVI